MFRLALALGKTLGEIEVMSYAEYLEWQEYYALEPFGLAVQDATQAHIVSTLANVNRDSKKRPEAYRIADFMLFPRNNQSEAEAVMLADPDAQSELIKQSLFGKRAQ